MSNFNRYITAAEVIRGTAYECGIIPDADPYASEDEAQIQLQHHLNTAGRELISAHQWQRLIKEGSITVNYGDSGSYAIPEDFDRFVNESQWNRTTTFPLEGPWSPQQWQFAQAEGITSTPNTAFRLQGDYIKVYPTPPASGTNPYATIYYEYVSRGWVYAPSNTQYYDYVAHTDDLVLYDSMMIIKMLKLRFLSAKGFDTTTAAAEFTAAFNRVTGRDVPARSISIVQKYSFPYIDPEYVTGINQ
jgi:hypothetical protein